MSCRTVAVAFEGAFFMSLLPAGVALRGLIERCFLTEVVGGSVVSVGAVVVVVVVVERGEVGSNSLTMGVSAALYLSALVGSCCCVEGAASKGLSFNVGCCVGGVGCFGWVCT